MGRNEKRIAKNQISTWNWVGTLFLSIIPGINIISFILFIIFAKTQSKRTFAIAALILSVLLVIVAYIVLLCFAHQLHMFSDWLRTL